MDSLLGDTRYAGVSVITIDTMQSRLDIDFIHEFLRHSYWAEDVPRSVVAKSIEHSLCFGVYDGDEQIGFARVISDFATYAYMADVFIVEEHRGKGHGRTLVQAIMSHPDLQGLKRWQLATKDAQGLYAKFGFTPLATPERWMEIRKPQPYTAAPRTEP